MTPPIRTSGASSTRHPGITRLDDGRWLVLKTWIDPKTGSRKFRRKVVTGTLDDAQRVRASLRGAEKSGPEQSRPKLREFADAWLKRHESKLEKSTFERYTADVANLNVEFGDWWVDAIDYDALEKWQGEMTAATYANATINGWHRTMRLILDVAVRRRLLASNPARELVALSEGRTKGARGTSLSASQMRDFLDGIEKAVAGNKITQDMGRALVALAWTGARLGEVLALRWTDDVDGELRIERTVWRGHEKEGKTDDPRRVTIVEPLRTALDEQRKWLLTTQHKGLSSGLVFPGNLKQAKAGASRRKGELLWYRSQSTLQGAVREVCKVAKTPRITPHSLRRTFEDLLREAGVEQLVRRAMAGWRSERAEGIYATVKREERDAAAGAMIKLVLG
jgi:integrase